VQQVDSPQNLYNKPCNEFVASFIGSPQMNMIPAKAEKEGDAVSLSFNNFKVKLNAEKSKNIADKGYVGKEVLMGIRPEDIHDEADFIAANPDSVINMSVELVELLGAETYLYLVLGENNITARVDPSSKAAQGQNIKVSLITEKIHVFDKESGAAITN
jgi:multiple sugar transport system ATP-binding protein